MRARKPYRVILKVHSGSYRIQRFPFLKNQGNVGVVESEAVARMEKIMSPLILHRMKEGIDATLTIII